MRRLLHDYALSIVLGLFFFVSWLLQTYAGWVAFVAEQGTSGANPFGADGYIWPWLQATFENWQSEFLQLFTFVVLTTFLIHRGSHESRDGQDKMEQQLTELTDAVARLEAAQATGKTQS
jgi:hypothetical protein